MIAAALLDQVLAHVARQSGAGLLERELATGLRTAFPGIRFTVCGEDEIPARLAPAAGNDVCQLFFVDASEHCLKLTADREAASGIVVALCADDE